MRGRLTVQRYVLLVLVASGTALLAYGGLAARHGERQQPAGRSGDSHRSGIPSAHRGGPARPDVEHDLATLLLPALGPRFHPADRARFPQGPLDLAAAARLEPDPDAERHALESRGFQRGYQRTWTTASGDVVGAVAYQFDAAPGAEGYLTEGASTVAAQGGQEFPVPFERARGFSQRDGALTVHTVSLTRGPYFFLFFVGSERGALTPDDARAVAAAQLGHLAGLW